MAGRVVVLVLVLLVLLVLLVPTPVALLPVE